MYKFQIAMRSGDTNNCNMLSSDYQYLSLLWSVLYILVGNDECKLVRVYEKRWSFILANMPDTLLSSLGFWKNLRILCRKVVCYAEILFMSVFVLNFYILSLKQGCRALYSKNKEGWEGTLYQSWLGSTLHPTCARWAYPIFGDRRQKLPHTSRPTS